MSQTQEVRSRSTAIFTDDDGMTKVVYHRTPVVAFDTKRVILHSGGYQTATTKLRMNQAANQFALGFQVFQRNYDWFVRFDGYGTIHSAGEVLPFTDGMEFRR